MKVIYKYKLGFSSQSVVMMPKDSKILDIQIQDNIICLWAIVDPKKELKGRVFQIYGTGHELISGLKNKKYITTVQCGSYVWHIFELNSPEENV